MCEMLVVRSEKPVSFESIFPYATLLDEYGVAGFGWGVVWRTEQGELKQYRSADGIRRDPLASRTLTGITSREFLIHLRRPSLMTSIAHFNAQPYLHREDKIAFAHNGYFAHHHDLRAMYPDVEGTSDSVVGFHHYLALLKNGVEPTTALKQTHEALGGKANLCALHANGMIFCYGGNVDNAMYRFQLGELQCVATSLHSHDDFLFQAIFPTASDIVKIPLHTAIQLPG